MSAHNSRHGTTSSISSRNTCRRVFFVYRSKPFIVARLLCCLFVDLIWRNLLYIPVERETLFRVSLVLIQPDGTIIDANRAALEAAGATDASAVIGRKFWEPWWSPLP